MEGQLSSPGQSVRGRREAAFSRKKETRKRQQIVRDARFISIRRFASGGTGSARRRPRALALYSTGSLQAGRRRLLGSHLLVGLDGLDVLVGLERGHRALGEGDGEALDEVVLVANLAALVDGLLLHGLDLVVGRVVLAGDNVAGHVCGACVGNESLKWWFVVVSWCKKEATSGLFTYPGVYTTGTTTRQRRRHHPRGCTVTLACRALACDCAKQDSKRHNGPSLVQPRMAQQAVLAKGVAH
jgi:hypothetical protein